MFDDKSREVLVVGAGPVGLFAALSLARRKVRVRVIDSGVWPCTHSYALALHPQSLALFAELGLGDSLLSCAYPVRNIALCDAEGKRAGLSLEGLVDGPSCLAVIGQEVLEGLLYRALRDAGVKVEWRQELASVADCGDHMEARIDVLEQQSRGYSVAHTEWTVERSYAQAVPFIIGADGHASAVRRALGIPYEETGTSALYAVFEFRSDAVFNNEMRIVMGDNTTDVVWPLPNGYCRWSFELAALTDENSSRWKDRSLVSHVSFPVLREESLKELLANRAPWFRGSMENFTWRTMVRFERRLAASFGEGRCWLAGDAAHLTGPIGMQSMNLGFFEARQLADTLSRLLREGGDLGELRDYGAHARHTWSRLHGAGHGLHATAGAEEWVAARASRLLACLPAHGDVLSNLVRQIGLEF